jgi:Trypsin-like peptidase domain
MFTSSAAHFFDCTCSVGGGRYGKPAVGRMHGMGCLLDKSHVLTAAHCWTGVQDEYEWPAVATLDGLYRCDVAFYSEESDILLLRLLERVLKSPTSLEQPERYAQLGDDQIFLGSQVGFISRLTLHKTFDETSTRSHFSAAFVSMLVPGKNATQVRFALSGTVMQKGFSGSPVFLPSGSIVGILVESLSFRANVDDENAPIYVLPVISPVRSVIHALRSVLETN